MLCHEACAGPHVPQFVCDEPGNAVLHLRRITLFYVLRQDVSTL